MILILLLYSLTYIIKLLKPWETERWERTEKQLMKMQEKNKNIDMVFSRYNVKIIKCLST